MAGEIKDFDPIQFLDQKELKRSFLFSQYAVAAGKMAVEDAGINLGCVDPYRIGIFLGTALPGMDFAEAQHEIFLSKGMRKVSPYIAGALFPGSPSSEVSMELRVSGASLTLSTGCPSSADAVVLAFEKIRRGELDVALAGGTESPVTPFCLAMFCVIKSLSRRNHAPTKASRPFDRERDGFVLSEGAGVLILEELEYALRRGAYVYAELLGYGSTCDAYHMTRPDPSGRHAAEAMRKALQSANLEPQAVDYINAHGSSTPLNDKTETKIIKEVFGDHAYRLPISSTKSMTGHSLGAVAAFELIASALAIDRGIIPPTINYENYDPECDLDYVPNESRQADIRVALSNSSGFGGKNTTLVIGKYEPDQKGRGEML
jgi:3-oxoacyl-[acyl-carrier-protein] synthase II